MQFVHCRWRQSRLGQKKTDTSLVTDHPGVLNRPADNSLADRVAMGTNHKAEPETSQSLQCCKEEMLTSKSKHINTLINTMPLKLFPPLVVNAFHPFIKSNPIVLLLN